MRSTIQTGLILLAVWLAGSTRTAWAGCPKTCDLMVEPVTIDPALSCLTVSTVPGTCDCGVELTVTNDCTDAITASDFVFRGCKLPGQDQFSPDCALLEPRGTGYLDLDIDGTGMKSWDLHLQQAETPFTMTVRANVTAFDAHPGCDCATSGRAGDFGSTGSLSGFWRGWLEDAARSGVTAQESE